MKLDTATFAFGYKVRTGGNTPNWSTSLGQSQINAYKINDYDGLNEIIKGMIYTSKSSDKISTKIGKGGTETFGNTDDSPIVLGSIFTRVKINDVLIPNGKFILLITRDTAESHKGRLKLKYGPSNKFSDSSGSYTNEMFFASVRNTLGLADNACWFVSELFVENQDTLKLKAIIVKKDGSVEYEDTKELHEAWTKLEPSELKITEETASNYVSSFSQTIYYGVPGSGKSHKIDEQTQNIPEEQKIRVVFHPEYTNADFVGQILPVVDGDAVKYTFKPGSFTRILVAALKNPEKPYYLIIEEINRGNAAAIFGEIFQLLDRGSDGWSSYCIMNDDINYEIRKTVPELNWTANTGIRLPPNLSLFATMNTSDQNVFTLDNAFQRRWEMELVQNQCDDSSQMNAKITVNNQSITWKNFQTQINSIIGEKSNEGGLSSMEDKRLGCWFIKAENGVIDEKKFANKVLKYLWDDAFKFYHQEIFESDIKNFEELQKRFFEKGFDVFSENCGLKDFLSTTQPDSESKSESTTPQDSESQSENSEQ
ncbi:MAG: McrB family protein [Treponema sp.]